MAVSETINFSHPSTIVPTYGAGRRTQTYADKKDYREAIDYIGFRRSRRLKVRVLQCVSSEQSERVANKK